MTDCIFKSKAPIADDVYKVPNIRYVCRSVERQKSMKRFSDRFIGESDCETCSYKQELNNNTNDTSNNK